MEENSKKPELDDNRVDGVVSLAKGVVGAAPFVGSLVSEVIGYVIPNQRIDRIAEFVRLLDERVKNIEKERLEQRFCQPLGIDLLEDALYLAARATSHERLEHIANVVAHGISAEEMNQAETKRMLWLLGQLNDQEVVILRSQIALTRTDIERDAEFRERHADLLTPVATHMGSEDGDFEEAALKNSYRRHLIELGLSRNRFKRVGKGEIPQFDPSTGTLKATGSEVTRLGKMLLRYLDIMPEWYQ